jgi:hypothetical protein
MAITRAQQFKQMLQNGGRIGLFGGGPPGVHGRETGGGFSDKERADRREDNRQQYSATQTQTGVVKGGGKPIKDSSGKVVGFEDRKVTGDEGRKAKKEFQQAVGKQKLETYKVPSPKVPSYIPGAQFLNVGLGTTQKFRQKLFEKNRDYFDKYIAGDEYEDTFEGYEQYMSDRLAGKIDARGNPIGDSYRDSQGNLMTRGGGQDQPIVPIVPTTTGAVTTDVVDNRTELEKLLDARGAAYRFFADGGRADDEEDYVGGIMDLESARQMYGLGKLVKKVTRGVKKIVKSPVGKAALGAALFKFGGGLGGLKGKLFGLPGVDEFGGTMGLLGKLKLTGGFGSMMPTALGGIGLASLASGLMTPKEQEEEEQYLGPTIDIPGIRKNPYAAMGETYRFYADGGKAEPVAKKTMPLLDMNGMEKDYRKDGGFVPIGRMERADDVPARLSKNEFVFTADAVRNAGDGDVDKGAEVMYNMMKNLEAGGNVSEESQGLDGARKMFQTSQRLEEVL